MTPPTIVSNGGNGGGGGGEDQEGRHLPRSARGSSINIVKKVKDRMKKGVSRSSIGSNEYRVSSCNGSVSSGRRASEQDDFDADDSNREGGFWDLESCINVIESLRNIEGLSPHQVAAIENLRVASLDSTNRLPETNLARGGSGGRHAMRREAKFFGKAGRLLTKELLDCFHEVEDSEDDVIQTNVTSVLANFGGQVFGSVSNIAPRADRRKSKKPCGLSEGGTIEEGKNDDDSSKGSFSSSLTGSLNMGSSVHSQEFSAARRDSRREAIVGLTPLDLTASIQHFADQDDDVLGLKVYCPPEWNALTKAARTELTDKLSWKNLSQWDFNVLDVADLTRETLSRGSSADLRAKQYCPLLIVGWAILCAPDAQAAMEGSLGDNAEDNATDEDEKETSNPYHFVTDLKLDPECICNFLRQVERQYVVDTPYHNNVHAADVTQTLHCLLQFIDQDIRESLYDPADLFSILLAATFHDVGHKGTNNLFQKNSRTALAIRYNDASILENMHSAVGHSLLMGEEKQKEWDVFKEWSSGQIEKARNVMVTSVLGTDMSKHFETVGELASLVEKVRAEGDSNNMAPNETENGSEESSRPLLSIVVELLKKSDNDKIKKECSQLANLILKFLLHSADISNPTKIRELCVYWANQALAEFFAQGDLEEAANLPISPLCDRRTVKKADSQIGFLKFVVRPTYVLVGEIIPKVKEEIIPVIDDNISYWTKEKSRMSVLRGNGALASMMALRMTSKRASIDEEETEDVNSDDEEENEEKEEHQ